MSETWHIDAAGVLTILPGFSRHQGQPDFFARRDKIKAIVVAEGISEIGDDWFCYLNQVRELVLPSTLRRIVLRSQVIESLDWIPDGAELINKFED